MPTYIYKFQDDKGGTVEVEQSIKADAHKQIDGRPVERTITATSFVLKGKGFYKTDYGSK